MENKAVGAPLHKFIGAFRFGLKAALNRCDGAGGLTALASAAVVASTAACHQFTAAKLMYDAEELRVCGVFGLRQAGE